jgi:streptogramin lyase
MIFLSLLLLMAAFAKDPQKTAATTGPAQGVKTPGVLIPFANLKSEAEVTLDGPAAGILTQDGVWIAAGSGLKHLDAKTNKPASPAKDIAGIDKVCGGLVNAFSHLWTLSCGAGTLAKADAKTGKVAGTLAVGAITAGSAIAASGDSIWVLADAKTRLLRVDPEENKAVAEIRLPVACSGILFAEQALWVACPSEAKLIRIDPATNLVEKRIDVAAEPYALAAGEGAIWVYSRKESKVTRVDPKTNKGGVVLELGVPGAAAGLAFGEGALWASMPGFPVTRIRTEAEKERVVQQFHGVGGGWIHAAGGAVWTAGAASNAVVRLDPKRVAATLIPE